MNLKKELAKRYDKSHTVALSVAVLQSPELSDELWQIMRRGESPLPQRAAWVMQHVGDTKPDYLAAYEAEILPCLHQDVHPSIHRVLLRTLSLWKIPEELESELYDLTLSWVVSPAREIAIRVHAMTVAAHIAMPYPELREEVAQVIEAQMSWGSAGFKSRAKRLLKKLRKG